MCLSSSSSPLFTLRNPLPVFPSSKQLSLSFSISTFRSSMADSQARSSLSVNPPPTQISKEMHGPDNSIPLSPQWLLPKPGESKTAVAAGENHPNPYSGSNIRPDVGKFTGNSKEALGSNKKKDVFRPAFLDKEPGRRDHWRDEERDTNSSIRRDRWREGDKEFGDVKKVDRWGDASAGKHFGEARRPPSERWTDLPRETGYDQRRESKWNTRWGPDSKEVDKWNDSGKHGDASHEKGLSHPVNHAKEEREGEPYRPWRPSSSQSRGRGIEPTPNQLQVGGKEGQSFGHGRCQTGDSTHPTFSLGRGRIAYGANTTNHVSPHTQTLGILSDKDDNSRGESSPIKYSRMKLLDVYRVVDMRSSHLLVDGFIHVPSLTQEEALEPLALSAPTPDELAILRGIDKGDIVSSGAPQISKDSSAGRGSADIMQPRRMRFGSREDVSLHADESNDNTEGLKGAYSNFSTGLPLERQTPNFGSISKPGPVENHLKYADDKHSSEALSGDDASFGKSDLLGNRDSNFKGNIHHQAGSAWHPTASEQTNVLSQDQFGATHDARAKTSVMWGQSQKDHSSESEHGLPNSSFPQNQLKWSTSEDPFILRQASGIDRELDTRKFMQPSTSPEDLILYYKDPQGAIQGPFSGSDIIGWFEAGYFGIDLLVRLANAPPDFPFLMLGDVMPHLKAKRPPPGFTGAPKLNEIPDMSTRPVLSNTGSVLPGSSSIDLIREEQQHPHGSSTEAANRFLESLMAASNNPLERLPSSEGLQGYLGHNTSGLLPVGMESSDSRDLLAKRIALERQRSLSNAYPHWPPRDTAPIVSNPQMLSESSVSQSKAPQLLTDLPPQSSHPQNVDMMTILQGLAERPSVNINNGGSGWSNFSVPGGLDPFKDKLHHGQNFPQAAFSLPQQRMVSQNHPSVPNLAAQGMENPASILAADKLLSSALCQDPQVLNLLQQQYLLQMQSQAPPPGQPLSVLDKLLMLKQQQQQEEQLRHQQQLLTQLLTEQNQRFGDSSLEQLHAALTSAQTIPTGNAVLDQLRLGLPHQLHGVGPHIPVSNIQGDRASNLPSPAVQETGFIAGQETSLHLPNQIFGTVEKSLPAIAGKDGDFQHMDASLESRTLSSLPTSETVEKLKDDNCVLASTEGLPLANSKSDELASSERISKNDILVAEQAPNSMDIPVAYVEEPRVNEEHHDKEVPNKEEQKPVEAREAKKSSEKKSKKKSSKVAPPPSDQSKGTAKLSSSQLSKQSDSGTANNNKVKSDIPVASTGVSGEASDQGDLIVADVSVEPKAVESAQNQHSTGAVAQRAWKAAATNVKPKSLLEIQQEEQRRALTEVAVAAISPPVSTISLSAPWAGVVSSSDPKISTEVYRDSSEANLGKLEGSKSKKSPLHDLLAAEVLAKANEKEEVASGIVSGVPPLPISSTPLETVDEDDFIEAKDTKKSRKKGGKGKGAGNKSSSAITLNGSAVSSSPSEKGKNTRQAQPEKEVLPAPPQGPSLGDFVPWKGESSSPSPAPAWSADSAKLSKPFSMRDILKEEEKKGGSSQRHAAAPLPTPQKPQPAQVTRTNSWSLSGTSPSKAESPIQVRAKGSSQPSKEDDLFWGPPVESKQESRQGTKNTPVKGSSAGVALTRQKSSGGKAVEISSSPASAKSSLKGKRDGDTKHSEAMDFRDWCETESIRLTGSKDTSFLEFCVKQPRSEAEILLTQNLGSVDANHGFISKFLDYMEMLPADVLEMAFQVRKDRGGIATSYGGGKDVNSDVAGAEGAAAAKSGKKKGKKGKKVSPSVLGFSVVSNRIMKGEIQTIED